MPRRCRGPSRLCASTTGEVAERLEARLAAAERRLGGAVAHRALVRYDAYNEMSGHQSLSIALLDANRSGIVLSSIHHRDQARLYAKQVHAGAAELALSPRRRRRCASRCLGAVRRRRRA